MNFDEIDKRLSQQTPQSKIDLVLSKGSETSCIAEFKSANESAIMKFLEIEVKQFGKTFNTKSKRSHKEVQKLIKARTVSSLPQTELLVKMLEVTKVKVHKKYNMNTVESLMQNSNLYYSNHSAHNIDKNVVLTYNYQKLYFAHYKEAKEMFNNIWTNEFISYWNPGSKGLSASYTHTIKPNSTVYISIESLKDILYSVLMGKMSVEQYEAFYISELIKVKHNNRNNREIPAISVDLLNTELKTHTEKELVALKEQNTVKVHSYKTLGTDVFNKIVRTMDYLTERIENKDDVFYFEFHRTSYIQKLNELKRVKSMMKYNIAKDNYTLTYEASISKTAGRIYTPLNQLSKGVRAIIFGEGIEVDIDNMAFNFYLRNYAFKVKSEFTALRHYTSSNYNKVLVRKDVAKHLNVPVTKVKEIILSILFGSTDAREFKDNVFLKNLVKEVKVIRDYIIERDECSFDEAKSTMSKEFMKRETKIMDDLISELSLTRENIVDIHDGIIIPFKHIDNGTLVAIKKIEEKYKITFSGKTKIKTFLTEQKAKYDLFEYLKHNKPLVNMLNNNRFFSSANLLVLVDLLLIRNITKNTFIKTNLINKVMLEKLSVNELKEEVVLGLKVQSEDTKSVNNIEYCTLVANNSKDTKSKTQLKVITTQVEAKVELFTIFDSVKPKKE